MRKLAVVAKVALGIVIFLGVCFLMALARGSREEKAHRIVVDGQEYIRSKEYVGNNTYQVIMVPVKACPCKSSK